MKKFAITLSLVFVMGVLNLKALPHCEVPCGIYTDQLRIELIKEHITTIDKAMKQIEEFSSAEVVNYNQLVRWINTKEHHARLIQDIVEQYFMTQRVKPVSPDDQEAYKKYIHQLTLLHEMLVWSMKCKQSTDVASTQALSEKTDAFAKAYFGLDGHDHGHSHGHEH